MFFNRLDTLTRRESTSCDWRTIGSWGHSGNAGWSNERPTRDSACKHVRLREAQEGVPVRTSPGRAQNQRFARPSSKLQVSVAVQVRGRWSQSKRRLRHIRFFRVDYFREKLQTCRNMAAKREGLTAAPSWVQPVKHVVSIISHLLNHSVTQCPPFLGALSTTNRPKVQLFCRHVYIPETAQENKSTEITDVLICSRTAVK